MDGSTPEPAIRSGDTGLILPCFDSCQLITTLMRNQWAPKVARKCESKHWLSVVRTNGLSGGRAVSRCTVTWLPNFLGWVDYFIFLPMVLRWRASRARAPLLLLSCKPGIFLSSWLMLRCPLSLLSEGIIVGESVNNQASRIAVTARKEPLIKFKANTVM